jgi:hypothetical protein
MAYLSRGVMNESVVEPERSSETETLTRLQQIVREAIDHRVNLNWRSLAIRAYQYEEGDQLDAQTLRILKDRKQPPVVENLFRPQRREFMATYERARFRASFVGRNMPMDEAQSNALNDVNRYVDQDNQFVDEEAKAVKDMWISGIGWIERMMQVDDNHEARIVSRHESPFVMWPDPYGRRDDLSDHRYVVRGKWMDLDHAVSLWPDKEQALIQCLRASDQEGLVSMIDPPWEYANQHLFVDISRERLRPFEVWYRRRAKRKVAITPDGVKVTLDFMSPREASKVIKRAGFEEDDTIIDVMFLGIFCGGQLIHHDLSPYEHMEFPFTPYIYNRKQSGEPVGFITEDMISLQDAVNKRQSKALHLFTNRQVVVSHNAVKDKAELADELAQPDGIIELEQAKIDNHFQVLPNTDLGQGQLAMYAHARQAFASVAMTSDVNKGQAPGEVRSDRGLARLEANALALEGEALKHIKSARQHGLLLQTSLIQQFMTDDFIFQVTDDPDMVRVVRLSAADFSRIRQFHINLVMIEEHDYATTRQQQLDMLANALPQMLPFGAGWASVLLELTDLREKDKLLQMVQQMSQPPQPEPKVNVSISWSDMPVHERVMWAAKLGFPEEFIEMIQQGSMPSKTELMVQSDQLKQQSKERMEGQRLNLKALELDATQDLGERKIRLDAMKASAQEETKRMTPRGGGRGV